MPEEAEARDPGAPTRQETEPKDGSPAEDEQKPRKKKEKTYTLTREQMEKAELAAKQLDLRQGPVHSG